MLVFCFVDLLATDFLLAAIVTYVVSKGLSVFRFSYFSPCFSDGYGSSCVYGRSSFFHVFSLDGLNIDIEETLKS